MLKRHGLSSARRGVQKYHSGFFTLLTLGVSPGKSFSNRQRRYVGPSLLDISKALLFGPDRSDLTPSCRYGFERWPKRVLLFIVYQNHELVAFVIHLLVSFPDDLKFSSIYILSFEIGFSSLQRRKTEFSLHPLRRSACVGLKHIGVALERHFAGFVPWRLNRQYISEP